MKKSYRDMPRPEESNQVPVYAYKCLICGAPDLRVAGVHDDTAVCHLCKGLCFGKAGLPGMPCSNIFGISPLQLLPQPETDPLIADP